MLRRKPACRRLSYCVVDTIVQVSPSRSLTDSFAVSCARIPARSRWRETDYKPPQIPANSANCDGQSARQKRKQNRRARHNHTVGSCLASPLAGVLHHQELCAHEQLYKPLRESPCPSCLPVYVPSRAVSWKKVRILAARPLLRPCFATSEDQPCCAQHQAGKSRQ